MDAVNLMFQDILAELDRRIEERWTAGNLAHGFWRTGGIPPLVPVDTFREYGFWQARALLGSGERPGTPLFGQVSLSLQGGHTRMGVFLPNVLLETGSSFGESLLDLVARAHDGQPAQIVRRMGGDTLFDRIFTEAPFSADWFLTSADDPCARSILENHLAWRVIDLWESAIRVLQSAVAHRGKWVVHSLAPLPATITETLPITLLDVFQTDSGAWITVCDWADSAQSDNREEWQHAIQRALSSALPDHQIQVRAMEQAGGCS